MGWRAGEREAGEFATAEPSLPERLVERGGLLDEIVDALRARDRVVAVTGPGGAGKTVLAVQACRDRQVRRSCRDGIVWLEAGEGRDPVELLAALAHRLGMKDAATSFATVERGRELLGPELAGKRLLIVVDNVSERTHVDAVADLSATCPVLVTCRVQELAAMVKATQVMVSGLTVDQSLKLLGLWSGHAPGELPPQAQTLCAKTGGLALAVTLAGAMAGNRSFPEALEWAERSCGVPDQEAETPPESEMPQLLIGAAIAAIPAAWQSRYEQLGVFAGPGAFPVGAAQALWHRHPARSATPLLEEFASRGLLTARGPGWYAAHDLHYEVLTARLGGDRLAAAHGQLLDGYRARYPRGWTDSVADPYLGRNLADHLRQARLGSELRTVLTDAGWIQARLAAGPVHELTSDYLHSVDPLTRQVMRILRLEAAELAADPQLVRSRLVNRLHSHSDPGITAWAATLSHDGESGGAARPVNAAKPAAASPPGQTLTGHDGPVRAVAVSHDGTRAVSGSDDGTVRVWNLTAGTEHATLTGHNGEVLAVAISPDGDRAVSGGSDRTLRVWDLEGGSEPTILAGHTRPVWSVAVTPDGIRAVSASGDGTVRVWDLTTGTEHAALTGHNGEVFTVAISRDGDRAVSSGSDGTLRHWNLSAGRPRGVLTGHTGWVRAVMLAHDKSLAVSGGEDACVRVWDLTGGTEQFALTGHNGEVLTVAITSGGDRALSGGNDHTVRVWDLAAIKPSRPQPSRGSGTQPG